ncbi:MAG: PD40 domain-containing protein, partial [Dehalococcoidia bacterium]|nr:PD40 domain-containing protein [Dehalococcoidia bacterium]
MKYWKGTKSALVVAILVALLAVVAGCVRELEAVTIPPVEVAAGETQQLEAIATDEHGESVSKVDVAWTVTNENVGSVTEAGLLTANEVAGTFSDAVEVQVTQGELVRTAVASVTITPGPLEQVVIAPNPAEIGMEMTQQFVAVGADQYGNRISGLVFTWSVENGGGTIDETGLFTAATTPDTYQDTVKAITTQADVTWSATASVTVEPDRIVFTSDREDDQWDIYIMEADGTNVERLTTTSVSEFQCSWSPDGRRIAYESYSYNDGIMVMNDDGSWKHLLIENETVTENELIAYLYPDWSPDGSQIAFIKATVTEEGWEDMDIFVMDVDGGNVIQLTDTPNVNEWVPAWSPDGTKIVYEYVPPYSLVAGWICYGCSDIYVMNADGTNPRALASHVADDNDPAWS